MSLLAPLHLASMHVSLATLPHDTIPEPTTTAPPGVSSEINTFLGYLKWLGLAAGIAGLMICGIMMTIGRRNRNSLAVEGATGIPWTMGGLTVVAFAASIAGAVLT